MVHIQQWHLSVRHIMKFKQDTSIRMHTYQVSWRGVVPKSLAPYMHRQFLCIVSYILSFLIQILPGYLKTTRRETTDIVSPNYSHKWLLCIIALHLVRCRRYLVEHLVDGGVTKRYSSPWTEYLLVLTNPSISFDVQVLLNLLKLFV